MEEALQINTGTRYWVDRILEIIVLKQIVRQNISCMKTLHFDYFSVCVKQSSIGEVLFA